MGVKNIIDPPYSLDIMSAKELGQIHTVNYRQSISSAETFPLNAVNVDLPGQLTAQLQRLIRAGTYHKVVGIDMTLDTVGTQGGGQVTGRIRYYAPTRGRCEAFRGAYKAMRNMMKTQGINTITNKLYDFRAPLNDLTHASGNFLNRATLDGKEGLALYHTTSAKASIFDVHNSTVRPVMGTQDPFPEGFDTLLANTSDGNETDFVLNDVLPYTGNVNSADTEYEEIPFMLTWTPDTTDFAVNWNWRPDPALYLAVLCGQMSIIIEELNVDGDASAVNLNVAVMVSGWKSIMGNPDKKRSTRKSKSKKRVKN